MTYVLKSSGLEATPSVTHTWILCGLVKKCQNLTFKVNLFTKVMPNFLKGRKLANMPIIGEDSSCVSRAFE